MTRTIRVAAILTVSSLSLEAWAQSTVFDEITVTAHKRESEYED